MDIFSKELRGITAYQKLPWHTATERVLGCSIVKLWLYFSYHLAELFSAYQGISIKEHTFQLYSTFVFNKWIIAQIRIWSYQQAQRIQNTAMTEEVGNTRAEVVTTTYEIPQMHSLNLTSDWYCEEWSENYAHSRENILIKKEIFNNSHLGKDHWV